MAYLIGTDEAGYGPNLGPLVISATRWRLPDALLDADLYEVLAEAVVATPDRPPGPAAAGGNGRLTFADSKRLYQSGGSLAPLERGVLAALSSLGANPRSWQTLFDTLDPAAAERAELPWYRDFDVPLPVDAEPESIAVAGGQFTRTMQHAGVALDHVKSRILCVPRFNDLIDRHGNKAAVLSRTTLDLVADLIAQVDHGPIRVVCDKHGGRNRYAALLQELADTGLVQVIVESRRESRYRLRAASRQVDIRFVARGERFLPSALASMISKYVRELAMLALNRYWCDRADGLKPTAGYPVDARRWRDAIQQVEEGRQIPERQWWRCR